MTTTTIISGQAIGSGANAGNSKFPTKLTLAATSVGVVLTMRVTNSATSGVEDARSKITLHYAMSPVSVTAAAALELLKQNSRYLEMFTVDAPSADRARDTELIPVTGQYLYVWVDVPVFLSDATLNVYATEL